MKSLNPSVKEIDTVAKTTTQLSAEKKESDNPFLFVIFLAMLVALSGVTGYFIAVRKGIDLGTSIGASVAFIAFYALSVTVSCSLGNGRVPHNVQYFLVAMGLVFALIFILPL